MHSLRVLVLLQAQVRVSERLDYVGASSGKPSFSDGLIQLDSITVVRTCRFRTTRTDNFVHLMGNVYFVGRVESQC